MSNPCVYRFSKNVKGHLKGAMCGKTETFQEKTGNYKCRVHLEKQGLESYCEFCKIVINNDAKKVITEKQEDTKCLDCVFMRAMPASLYIFEMGGNVPIENVSKEKIKELREKYFHANWNKKAF